MSVSSLAFTDVKGGMNAADTPHTIAPNQVARMVNCAITDGLPSTRFGVRIIPISGDAAEFLAIENVQGSTFFNPAKGQGGIGLADSKSMIAVAAGGRKLVLNISGRRERTTAEVTDVTGGLFTSNQLHLVWWLGAEDLLLANDGQSNCWIWDTVNPAEFSPGYNVKDKLKSQVPNGGTVLTYAHGRIIAVVNSRVILAGDNIFRTDSTSSDNLRDFVEQDYWATGQFFLPPTSIGNIIAAKNLMVPGQTNDGYSGTWFHLEDGLFPINFNIYPRSAWVDSPMVKTALETPGATGPYAVTNYLQDQFFGSPKGLMSLQWALGQAGGGNSLRSISGEVDCWLKGDCARWLRFRSLESWYRKRRLFMTVNPIVRGRFRWHRGMVVRNMSITETSVDAPAWEGLWTMPPQCAGIVQFVKGTFDGEERIFAWTRGTDGRTRLVEFCTYLGDDVLEDGSHAPIPCQVVTRAIDAGKIWEMREHVSGRLYLRNIVGFLKWGVWYRTSESPGWAFWRAGTASNASACGSCDLGESPARAIAIPLGDLPKLPACAPKEGRWIQFLVRWQGRCQLENIRVSYGEQDILPDNVDKRLFDYTFAKAHGLKYDEFEYCSSLTPEWTLQKNQ